jgi:hypothetical protein
MAGTTMIDSGLVLEAFRTIEGFDVVGDEAASAEAHVVVTMGQTTIDVFATLFSHRALKANEMFDRQRGSRRPYDCRDATDLGLQVELTTG